MKALVTGGAGFIGSSLCESLVDGGDEVVAFDNFSSGSVSNLSRLKGKRGFKVTEGDVRSRPEIRRAVSHVDMVYHFAAYPEVRLEKADPETCFEENVLATKALLEAIRGSGVHCLVFASSSTVYGDAEVRPTPEDYSPMLPISIYGACKLASEALIVAYAKTYGFDATILRFANIVGPRSNHGVVPDFIRKLRAKPNALEILGNGSQLKSYLHIDDCVSAVITVASASKGISIFNIGSGDQIDVREVADIICNAMKLRPQYRFTGGIDGGRGWQGDVMNMLLGTTKLRSLGWKPERSSAEAVRMTVGQILGASMAKPKGREGFTK